jgi:molecular chaperone IbpA
MTHLSVFGPGFKDFDKYFVGFEDQLSKLAKAHDDLTKNIPNYPPYNIKKTGDNTYAIELAVAGFGKHDIEIELAEGKLIVKGSTADTTDDNFIFKGIANRAFTRAFAIDDQIEVQDAEMLNGMLRIFLERIIPEHKKPRLIKVNEKKGKDTKEFLVE